MTGVLVAAVAAIVGVPGVLFWAFLLRDVLARRRYLKGRMKSVASAYARTVSAEAEGEIASLGVRDGIALYFRLCEQGAYKDPRYDALWRRQRKEGWQKHPAWKAGVGVKET